MPATCHAYNQTELKQNYVLAGVFVLDKWRWDSQQRENHDWKIGLCIGNANRSLFIIIIFFAQSK